MSLHPRSSLLLKFIHICCYILLIVVLALPMDSQGVDAATSDQENPVTPTIYIVQAGDTLYQIALRHGVTVEAIVEQNQLANPNVLQIGQRLVIPNGSEPGAIDASVAEMPTVSGAETEAYSISYACSKNSSIYSLALPADPIRMVVLEESLYFVADGDLYSLPIAALPAQETLTPVNLIPPGRKVDKYSIQELVYVSVIDGTEDLLVLDKTNDIYRFSRGKGWEMAYAAAPIPGQFPDPQFLAVQAIGDSVYTLDSDLSSVWSFAPSAVLPRPFVVDGRLSSGIDFVLSEATLGRTRVHVLTREGDLLQVDNGWQVQRIEPFSTLLDIDWPAQIVTSEEHLWVVSADRRSVIAVDAATGQVNEEMIFRFPQMQRLRSAAIHGDTLFGLAGRILYTTQVHPTSVTTCSPVVYDNSYVFQDVSVDNLIPNAQLPFAGAFLPMRPRSYPGARRLYRYGIHKGVDLYSTEVAGLGIGSPVRSIAEGKVIRIDSNYQEFTPAEYDDAMAQAEAEHQTPLQAADRLLGRQVRVEHGAGIESWYGHLSTVSADITEYDRVEPGEVIGRVGVSGTSAGAYGTQEGVHLHFEIWVNGRYLGQGLSLYETMRLWQALFNPEKSLVHNSLNLPPIATPSTGITLHTSASELGAAPELGTRACHKPPDDYTRTTINGVTINARTLWMLNLANQLYKGRGDPLRVTQGSYTDDVDASFGTHSGGGVVDISIRAKDNPVEVLTLREATELVVALRQAGFAAWLRLPTDLNPPSPLHIHAVAVGDRELSAAARLQLDGPEGYFRGMDGVPPEHGGPKADRYGGPVLCNWMVEAGYQDLQ